jgi:hypothetical protein
MQWEETIILTREQKRALEQGDAVPVCIDDTECVVVRRDIYERVKRIIHDHSPVDPEETYPLIEATLDDVGLERYQQYKRLP